MTSAAFQTLFCGGIWMLASAVVAALEVNLSDTRLATTDLNWDTYSSGGMGWTELTSTDENQVPLRSYQTCDTRGTTSDSGQTSEPDNWLKMDYIELKEGAKNVFVEIKFTIRSCQKLPNAAATCKETFNLYYLEANSPDSGADKFMSEAVYKKVDTIAADERFPVESHVTDTETRKIGPIKAKGIYIAFQDTGACMLIYYVRIYYKKCGDVVQNLARFPSTITGPEVTSLVKVTGQCVANAVWSETVEGPSLLCNGEGEWKLPVGSCRCVPGYTPNENMTRCSGCSTGRYKPSTGNGRCETCPDNSLSVKFASIKCICSAGYYRSGDDDPTTSCTRPPSKPESIELVVNKASVFLQWSPPKDSGGRTDIYYSISCMRCDSSYVLCSTCGDTVYYEPRRRYLQQPHVTVTQLSPHTNYRFKVYSHNGVTEISGKDPSYAEAMLKTSETAPSAVGHVRVIEQDKHEVLLNWDMPVKPNGVILEYEVRYISDGIRSPKMTRVNRTKSQTFRIKHLPEKTSFIVQVRARNAVGDGLFSTPVTFRTLGFNDDSRPPDGDNTNIDFEERPTASVSTAPPVHAADNLYLLIGIAAASFLVMVVVVTLIAVVRSRKVIGKHTTPMEVFPFFNNTIDIVHSQSEPRTYVDPSTYGDPSKAVHEFTKEIDSFNIKKEELLGSGEFGDVFKGFLRPVTPVNDDGAMYMTASFPSSTYVVAIKTLKPGFSEKEREDFLMEASIMGQFDHANVIRLEGVVTKATPLMIITEFMEKGSLDTFLEDRNIRRVDLEVTQLVGMLRDVASGMDYLSRMGYVHRDLAARNVLVNSRLVCKVSDFGLSRALQNIEDEDTAIYTTKGGLIPVRWTAPEAITMRTFTSSSDVWSFGIVTWEVLTLGERPYWEMLNPDVIHCVQCGYRLPPPAFCPRVLHNLMLNCWNTDRTRRPTFRQIVAQLDSTLVSPYRLQDTINNMPVYEQPECVPESLDLSSLGQWLEDMNMAQYKDIMMRYGCVTAEQIIRLCPSQLNEMRITDVTSQQILLNGVERLGLMLGELSARNNRGMTV